MTARHDAVITHLAGLATPRPSVDEVLAALLDDADVWEEFGARTPSGDLWSYEDRAEGEAHVRAMRAEGQSANLLRRYHLVLDPEVVEEVP